MPSGSRTYIALLVVALCAAMGCGPRFALPRLVDPQTASQRLAYAKAFDPYPDPTVGSATTGGGDMSGARPLGFMDPRPEPDLLAKQQMTLPMNDANRAGPPIGMSAPPAGYPAGYVPPATAYPPGSYAPPAYSPPGTYPPTTSAAAPVATTGGPQVIYPQAGTSPAWTVNNSSSGVQTVTPAAANGSVMPTAYGKAIPSLP
jgi:hypothetical protein